MTARRTPASPRLAWRFLPLRIDWPMRKAPSTVGTVTTRVVVANTATFAHRTGRRAGTAAKVARIIPVAYSPVMNRTPSTPIASWARKMPARLRVVGSNLAASPGSCGGQCATVTEGTRTASPRMKTTAASREKTVERSERSLVHSESRTRACVTFWRVPPERVAVAVAVLIGRLQWSRGGWRSGWELRWRSRGTRRSPS